MTITYQAMALTQVKDIHDAIMHRMTYLKKQASTTLTYIEMRKQATVETIAELDETNPGILTSYNTRDTLVNQFLETWASNPSSPLVVPYIDSDTGQLKLCDYMKDQGLIIAGTDQADLTNFMPSPKVSWNNVQINNAMIRGFFKLTPEVTGLNVVNCDVDGAVIGCGEDYSPVVIKNSSFSYLTYSALTFYNARCVNCDFLYARTTTAPVFDEHFQAIINELAQIPTVPTGSVIHLHKTMLDGCDFTEFPLSNLWADEATIHNGTFDTASASLFGVFGDADESFNVIEWVPTKGLMLSGIFPNGISLTHASTALSFNNIDGGTKLRFADFSHAIITLTAEQDSSTLTQNLSQVDLTGSNFTNATVWFAGKPYEGLDIAALFAALGMPTDIITTMTFVAPAQVKAPALQSDDASYNELRTQAVAYALTNWYCNTTSLEFSPYINQAGQFDLGAYLIGLGFTITNPATGQAVHADLTGFTLDLATIVSEANPPFSGASLLDNVVINNASFENGILKLGDTVSTNFGMNNVIVEGLTIQANKAQFVNSQFSNLFFDVFPMQTHLGSETCLTFTHCAFTNRTSLTTPVALDPNDFWVSHFINKCQSSTYALSHNMIFALATSFDNCQFQNFPLNNMYAGLTSVIAPLMDAASLQEMLDGLAGSLAEPVLDALSGELPGPTLGDGLILQGTWPFYPSFVGIQTAAVFMPGIDMQAANFSDSIIFISSHQKFDEQIMINWANFTDTKMIYQGQVYTGQNISTLLANLGMSAINLNTMNFGPSASSVLTTKLDDKTPPVPDHDDALKESSPKTTPLSQNTSGFLSKKVLSKGKEEDAKANIRADKSESSDEDKKGSGHKDDKENESDKGPRK